MSALVCSDSLLPEWKQRRSIDMAMPNDPKRMLAEIEALYPRSKIEYEYKTVKTRGLGNTIQCIATLHRGQDARSDIVGRSSTQMCCNRLYAQYQAIENLLGNVRQSKQRETRNQV
jgi:hypothetical protein